MGLLLLARGMFPRVDVDGRFVLTDGPDVEASTVRAGGSVGCRPRVSWLLYLSLSRWIEALRIGEIGDVVVVWRNIRPEVG